MYDVLYLCTPVISLTSDYGVFDALETTPIISSASDYGVFDALETTPIISSASDYGVFEALETFFLGGGRIRGGRT
jgi:hypothetical protein